MGDSRTQPGTDAGQKMALDLLESWQCEYGHDMPPEAIQKFLDEVGFEILEIEAQARSAGYEYGLLHNEAPEIGALARASRRAAVRRIRERLFLDQGFGVARDHLVQVLDEEAAR